MIVVGSCYFLLTLLIPYDPNIDFVFPLTNSTSQATVAVTNYIVGCHVVLAFVRSICKVI